MANLSKLGYCVLATVSCDMAYLAKLGCVVPSQVLGCGVDKVGCVVAKLPCGISKMKCGSTKWSALLPATRWVPGSTQSPTI